MYNQIDKVAVDSPLAPILANIFMWYHKKGWEYNYEELLCYKSYVNDIFAVFETMKDHAVSFYNYINRQRSDIKFDIETEKTGNSLF